MKKNDNDVLHLHTDKMEPPVYCTTLEAQLYRDQFACDCTNIVKSELQYSKPIHFSIQTDP